MPSIKLSVTARKRLEKKYSPEALAKIDFAIKNWVAADAARGIQTVHIALDDPVAMGQRGLQAITGTVTARRAKRAIDALWKAIDPAYLVIIGAEDVVPYFDVTNPSYDPGGDDDTIVPTDNPYACSGAFKTKDRASYLIPDRAIGRIPDMVGDGDPSWLTSYLARATAAQPRSRDDYAGAYGICCHEWSGAGRGAMQEIGEPTSSLLISPPAVDTTPKARQRLGARLHMIKCHGAQLDPRFFGQKGGRYPIAVTSATLKTRITPSTIAGAMCCYGAQVFNPNDPAAALPGEWPIASTYLRQAALGFAGSTMIAWVGVQSPLCADWIVTGYLKAVLAGASIARAFLEAKQDYVRWLSQQGWAPGVADEKTLVEFVLLGDPSIHPVEPGPGPALAAAGLAVRSVESVATERRMRRTFRHQMARTMQGLLPSKEEVSERPKERLTTLFGAVRALMDDDPGAFKMRAGAVRVQRVVAQYPTPRRAAAGPAAAARPAAEPAVRRTLEYYWSGRRMQDGFKDIRLVKLETDMEGRVLRSVVLRSS